MFWVMLDIADWNRVGIKRKAKVQGQPPSVILNRELISQTTFFQFSNILVNMLAKSLINILVGSLVSMLAKSLLNLLV